MAVQMISMNVLCVVFDGTGFALARKRNITQSRRPSTISVITVMTGSRITWLNQ